MLGAIDTFTIRIGQRAGSDRRKGLIGNGLDLLPDKIPQRRRQRGSISPLGNGKLESLGDGGLYFLDERFVECRIFAEWHPHSETSITLENDTPSGGLLTLEIGLDEILKIPENLFGKARDAVFLGSRFLL